MCTLEVVERMKNFSCCACASLIEPIKCIVLIVPTERNDRLKLVQLVGLNIIMHFIEPIKDKQHENFFTEGAKSQSEGEKDTQSQTGTETHRTGK